MAEFKLGRIRFVWKGEWAPDRSYFRDDIVRLNGKTYTCVAGHTSSALFSTDEADVEPKWELVADGQQWRGDWATETRYEKNDIVKYGGYLYISNTAHTSAATATLGLEDDQIYWDLFAEGFDWKGDWGTAIRYKINDIVKYNSYLYLCTQAHTSAPTVAEGLELDQSKWDVFTKGFEWRLAWATGTRYRKGDIVKYGGILYVANTGHTSAATEAEGLEADIALWDPYHNGIEYRDDWTANTRYRVNDLVKYGGSIWICKTYHTSTTSLANDEINWEIFVPGLEFEDSWDNDAQYQPGDFVTYGGYSYVAKTNNQSSVPPFNDADWQLFVTGFNFRGDWGADSTNEDYRVGDVVRLNGFTYLCIETHNGQMPPNITYWEKLNSGILFRDTWANTTYYNQGDVVNYGVNAYICILEHTADTVTNRPDVDVSGTYWKLLAGGPEAGNLTTTGDIVYYSGSGPTRLPVGQPGQVLVVNDDATAPAWVYLGKVNNAYYVSLTGIDEPAPRSGASLDRPWRTVRYAAEQVLNGAEFYNSRHLLELNRSFIQAETVEWIDFQINNVIAPFTGAFVYDKAKFRRDIGIIIDAVAYDMSRGGNAKSREAALAYFTELGASNITGQETETVAAINYAIEVIDAVLSNVAPAANYQTLNGVGSVITQQIDTTFTEEATAQTLAESLIGIVTDAITAGNINNIPAERKANNTIFVKTGEFEEVLPIIVSENTAVVGDELRSTRVRPAGSLVSPTDVSYSLAGIARLQAVISDVVRNISITKSTSNAENQVTTRPAGAAAAGTAAAGIVQDIYNYIDNAINGTGSSPTPAGSNTPETSTDFTYAVEVLEANRTFLIEEVIGFIADTYVGYTYNEDKCRRDVSRYIDAVKDGLIYTGNYRAILAGRYYVNAVNGSLQEDMFYMRNGSGLRNCTVIGLTGTLSSPNAYGTRRPSAGAYVSLDPGWGPAHQDAWIRSKSPYIQNVTTFGTGCIGLKVDGDLHDGGNDSIVANDFTQIISDGIGAWVTNLGRSELVSVFSYYAHIAYLAENGGKIRATNGNNSYGDFGSVAEGIDITETPITGTVNNRGLEAQIGFVYTDGDEQILQLEYTNAGREYTNSTTAIQTITNISPADENRTVGTYSGLTGTSDGAGTGQEFLVIVTEGGLANITIVKGGSGHAPGDTITIADADLGGGGGNDLTFVVNLVGDATVFTITGEGFGAQVDTVTVTDGGVTNVRILETVLDPSNYGGAGYLTVQNNAQIGNSTSIRLSLTDTAATGAYNGMAIWILSGKGAGQYGYIDTFNAGTKEATIRKVSDDSPGWDVIVPGTPVQSALDITTAYIIEPRVTFSAPISGTTARGRARVADGRVVEIRIIDPGSGYTTPPTMTLTDPNNTIEAPHEVFIGNGVLGQPTWTSRGTGFVTAQAEVSGDGYAEIFQPGTYVRVEGLTSTPVPGANVEFSNISGKVYKLVNVTSLQGSGPFFALLQVSPELKVGEAPTHGDTVTMRSRYSQVRLTGHDFLDIGTGNFTSTNYPGVPLVEPDPEKETVESGGGRVFYTSTDQDGNFRVGGLFNVEQATGIATLNVDAFNISGLQELQLGEIGLGEAGAVIREFSTDGTFAADSDNIVPTQKAIKTYISSQIGGGASTLNVNSVTAGLVEISGQQITTTTGEQLNILAKVNFTGGISGAPVAFNYFLLS